MESSRAIPPDRDKISIVHQVPTISPLAGQQNTSSIVSSGSTTSNQQTNLERLSRPLAFDKMEILVREMQDPENGVPVRQQKMFLTSIPYAFMGYDLIEWLMDKLSVEEQEALNISHQLCYHGYFFPVNDTKTLVVKDDSSLYRFQTPYYWPWQHKAPDNVEYAIYLAKRSLRNKQRHGLEDYESDALNSLHKNLKGKWDFISMQAEEQVRLAKDRKKGDKIVSDSQERAYWRVHRPPPGQFTPLEPCPVPSRDRQGSKPKKKSIEDWQREVEYLNTSLSRTRMKMSQVCESLTVYWETFSDYEFFLQPVLPSNPWITGDIAFFQFNSDIVDIPTTKRVKRWAISIEELVSDQTGLQEFTNFLEKEYSHENIRFWMDVNRLRRSAHSQVTKKVREIYEEFLKPGAPCEINIDGKTMDIVQQGLKNPTRFTFDAAAEHIYTLLLKKDCYPRFVRSEHFKSLLASGIVPSHKKSFFNFGGVTKKKTVQQPSNQGLLAQSSTTNITSVPSHLSKRRGSDRSLTGSAHELAVIGTKDAANKVPHSHSQSNLSDIPYSVSVYRGDMPNYSIRETSSSGRLDSTNLEPTKLIYEKLETTVETTAQSVCPWESDEPVESSVQLSVCPWDEDNSETSDKKELLPSKTQQSEITEVSERMKRSCGLRQQNTVDTDYSTKKLLPITIEQRRSSMTITTISSSNELQQFGALNKNTLKKSTTPSPTTFNQTEITSKLETTSKLSKSDLNPLSIQASDIKCDNKQIILDETSSKNLISFSLETKPVVDEQLTEMTVDPIIPCDIIIEKKDNIILNKQDDEIIDISCKLEEELLDMQQIHERKILRLSTDRLQPNQKDEIIEELSPTTEEYQEGAEFCEQEDTYENDDKSVSTLGGYVAPAPTPAPSLAPLAEIETDPDDPELKSIDIKPEQHQDDINKNRRKKKRSSDAKKLDEKFDVGQSSKTEESNRNAVCPWEDEDGTTTDGTFTKTYATLGYL